MEERKGINGGGKRRRKEKDKDEGKGKEKEVGKTQFFYFFPIGLHDSTRLISTRLLCSAQKVICAHVRVLCQSTSAVTPNFHASVMRRPLKLRCGGVPT